MKPGCWQLVLQLEASYHAKQPTSDLAYIKINRTIIMNKKISSWNQNSFMLLAVNMFISAVKLSILIWVSTGSLLTKFWS